MGPRLKTTLSTALLALSLAAAVPHSSGQVFKIGLGSSSLYDAQGGSFEMQGHKYTTSLGLGVVNGKLLVGAQLKTRYKGYQLIAGDDIIRFQMPTDIFDSGHYFLGRGLGVQGKWNKGTFYAFGGATSDIFATPFLHVASANQPVGVLFFDVPLSERVHFFSRNAVSKRQTAIQGLPWKKSKKTEFDLAGGMGANQPYFAAAFQTDKEWISVKASYILAGDNFRRVAADTQVQAEVDQENIVVTLRPKPSFSISVGHQNLLQPAYKNNPTVHATVNEVSGGGNLKGVRLGAALFQSESAGRETTGTSFWGGRRLGRRLDLGVNYFRSQSGNSPVSSSMSVNFRQIVNTRLEVLEVVTRSNGQTTAAFGGQFTSNRLTVGVDYQTVYVPFLQQPFKQALTFNLRVRPFGNVQLNAQTYLAPDGKVRYTTSGQTFLYRASGLTVGDSPRGTVMAKNIVRGHVVDESERLIAGAALEIDKELVLTDSTGSFFLRTKKAKEVALKVLTDQFIAPGLYEVVSAPQTVQAEREEVAREVTIVVKRASSTRKAASPPAESSSVENKRPGGR
jgi:hypothetical protein